ncbi:MAG: hypothetical protein CMF74_00680 [Maricaulis sp.]|nr:hypothetical protein [Maricaulis sp.]|tara:strand:+ start:3317 stop:3718 length:402 start_codon:yes stop_codon:yes gene_type:complete
MQRLVCNLGELESATAAYGGLGVTAGAKTQLIRNTLLYKEGRQFVVDTPHIKSSVRSTICQWPRGVEAHCKKFDQLIKSAIRSWNDIGGKSLEVELSFAGNVLKLSAVDGDSRRATTMPARYLPIDGNEWSGR